MRCFAGLNCDGPNEVSEHKSPGAGSNKHVVTLSGGMAVEAQQIGKHSEVMRAYV